MFHVPSCFSILRKMIQILQRTLHEILIFTSYIDGSVLETLGNFSLPGLHVLIQRSKVMIVIEIKCVLDKNCLLFDIIVGVFFSELLGTQYYFSDSISCRIFFSKLNLMMCS